MVATIEQTHEIKRKLARPNLSEEEYKQIRFEFFKLNESCYNSAYDDGRSSRKGENLVKNLNGKVIIGKITIGIGFNMDNQEARKLWHDAFTDYDLEISFDEVYTGKRELNDYDII